MDDQRSDLRPVDFVPTQRMKRVYNPFQFTLKERESTLIDGACFILTAQAPAYLLICWGVNIKDAYQLQSQPWARFRDVFANSETAQDELATVSVAIERRMIEVCGKEEFTVRPPEGFNLGAVPRAKYPLALFFINQAIHDEECLETSHNQVVSQIIFVHLSDEVCPAQSHIIGNFVRTPHGHPCNIQSLFTSDHQPYEQTTHHPSPENSENSDSGQPSQHTQMHEEGLSSGGAMNATPTANTADLNSASDYTCTSERNVDEHMLSSSETLHSYRPNISTAAPLPKVTCIVCQVYLVDRVILPCRHVCVCEVCFPQMERCPMCRGQILSTFCLGAKINSEAYGHQENNVDEQTEESWFIRLNNRLNSFFGFS